MLKRLLHLLSALRRQPLPHTAAVDETHAPSTSRPPIDLRTDAREQLTSALAAGFADPDSICDDVAEALLDDTDEPADVVERIVRHELAAAIAARAEEQRTWPAATDCDRLDAAFEELNAEGIMARHNWTCCHNCGRAEMPDEFDRLRGIWNGRPIVGYAFYHQQSVESVVEHGTMHLYYGDTKRHDDLDQHRRTYTEIGRRVLAALTRQGLAATWDGDPDAAIHISLDWKRRAPPPRFC